MEAKLSFEDFLDLGTPHQMHVIDGLPARQIMKLMIHMERRLRPYDDEWHPLDITYAYCGLVIEHEAAQKEHN